MDTDFLSKILFHRPDGFTLPRDALVESYTTTGLPEKFFPLFVLGSGLVATYPHHMEHTTFKNLLLRQITYNMDQLTPSSFMEITPFFGLTEDSLARDYPSVHEAYRLLLVVGSIFLFTVFRDYFLSMENPNVN